ncbi:MAG: ribonuclease III [Eubacterium sp.]|nr:ribonuclease III [Eubacterium sp.]
MASPLTLAYIGDAVYELVVRTIVIGRHREPVNKLNRRATMLVKAETQSEMVETLLPLFTKEEEAVYKRGRNAKSSSSAKNASIQDYRRATGFEAVMGWLYLKGETDRMLYLIQKAFEAGKEQP